MVIINHNQEFLSAYAHNSRVLVKENDMVNGGDKIAEIGSSGATGNMLHFEIRQDGQPVDPLQFLPQR
ncbi:M23 family metallopeptidase [Marinobacterium aestuariivivens]|uniref:M23 family metallopeptidase n=1 Tax=Marinobacterium aestuariivivens TaxID=1698799 RepID=A0ABW1ZXY0_9GAMM